jgi:hypothetical protein
MESYLHKTLGVYNNWHNNNNIFLYIFNVDYHTHILYTVTSTDVRFWAFDGETWKA